MEFETFYRRELQSVFRATFVFSGDRNVALDATQEAFARAFARWRRLRNKPWAGGWVMTTAMNLCRSHASYARRVESREEIELPGSHPAQGTRLDMRKAISTLSFRSRQAAVLYYIADFSVAEVADRMEITEGAVKSHLFRARKALARLGRDLTADELDETEDANAR